MKDGLVLAIEPMIGLGRPELVTRDDGWTIATADGSLSNRTQERRADDRHGAPQQREHGRPSAADEAAEADGDQQREAAQARPLAGRTAAH